MPITPDFSALPADDPDRRDLEDNGALDPDAVMVQLVCQTGPDSHDPNGHPDDRVRPTHAALHGTIWRLDDPHMPSPPMSYGCRCVIRYVANPKHKVASALLPVAEAEPERSAAAPARTWLNDNVEGWQSIQRAMAAAAPADRQAEGLDRARRMGVRDPREIVRLVAATMDKAADGTVQS